MNISRSFPALLSAAGLTLGVMSSSAAQEQSVLKARALIEGALGSAVSGEALAGYALFEQSDTGVLPTVEVSVAIRGLEPNTIHGVHIHEVGDCAPPDFLTAGGHFDPGSFGNSDPDANHPFHMGDLMNLEADENGDAFFIYRTSRITLAEGPVGILDSDGSAIIVHLNPDQGIPGPTDSGVSGGPRIACGVIQPVGSIDSDG